MKSKLTVPRRNPFVCLVLKKTGAGSHRKPNKSVRKHAKQQVQLHHDVFASP